MKSQKSIELLNRAVADELQAVCTSTCIWHFHLDDQGFGPLAALLRRIAIVEMGHIEMFGRADPLSERRRRDGGIGGREQDSRAGRDSDRCRPDGAERG